MKKQKSFTKIDWENQFKIKPRRNASKTHEVIKLLYTILKLDKHKKNLHWLRIYTEHPIKNSLGQIKICDIYIEDIKKSECFAIEIQNNISEKWMKETTEFYENWEKYFFKTNWILVKEKDFKELENTLGSVINKLKEHII